MEERRKSVRHRTLKGGRICFNDGSTSMDCVIRDISEGGAKLCFPNVVGIPSEFILAFDDGRPSRQCFSKWRKLTAMGVQFLSHRDRHGSWALVD
jgi:hypothetical protein